MYYSRNYEIWHFVIVVYVYGAYDEGSGYYISLYYFLSSVCISGLE